jgi:hypothetical protein
MKFGSILITIVSAAGVTPLAAALFSADINYFEEPYLWRGYEHIRDNTGELIISDRVGSKNFDVDDDGVDDIGFLAIFGPDLLVLAAPGVDVLALRVGGPNDLGGIASRWEAGSLIGPESQTNEFLFATIDPFSGYHYPESWSQEAWGEYWPNLDEALPSSIIVTGCRGSNESERCQQLWAGRSGYLAFRKQEEDGYHYGWFKIENDLSAPRGVGGYITEFAYETEANRAIIIIPEPASGILTALCSFLFLRRRR